MIDKSCFCGYLNLGGEESHFLIFCKFWLFFISKLQYTYLLQPQNSWHKIYNVVFHIFLQLYPYTKTCIGISVPKWYKNIYVYKHWHTKKNFSSYMLMKKRKILNVLRLFFVILILCEYFQVALCHADGTKIFTLKIHSCLACIKNYVSNISFLQLHTSNCFADCTVIDYLLFVVMGFFFFVCIFLWLLNM